MNLMQISFKQYLVEFFNETYRFLLTCTGLDEYGIKKISFKKDYIHDIFLVSAKANVE